MSLDLDTSFLTKFQIRIPEAVSRVESKLLPHDFVPTSKDVICGRGKSSYHHVGNRRFRVVIAMNLEKYVSAESKADKTQLVYAIVDRLREANPQTGGFVKRDSKSGLWVALDDTLAREKVGHALRDALSSIKSDTKKGKLQTSKRT